MSGSFLRLALFINPSGHHQAAWRHPGSQPDAGVNFEHYSELARAAERACFDAIFLADNQAVRSGPPEAVGRVSQYVANFEPLTMLSALAARTEHIGLVCTASTSFSQPYAVARMFASLDHISGGRAGWNIVTSGFSHEAHNFGLDEHYEHELRYERADEFVAVCKGLWDSWEDDAFPRDVESGQFSLPERMHALNHRGTHFRVRGPLNVPRSPQGYPLLVQAGQSATGMKFAAKHAEMVFVSPQTVEEAREIYGNIKALAAESGRNPDHVKVMPGMVFVVAPTTEAAQADYERLQSLVHIDVALNILSMKMVTDLSGYDRDSPIPESAQPTDASAAHEFQQWFDVGRRDGLTLRELAFRASGSLSGRMICGSPTEIADLMEEWFRAGAADGFNLQPAYLPGQLHAFIEHVVPELRARGIMRARYDGRTLRENFGVPRPAWRPPSGEVE